jgi:hypothetical protein
MADTDPSTPRTSFRQGRWVAPVFEAVLLLVVLGAGLTGLLAGLDAFLDDEVDTPVRLEADEVASRSLDGYRLDPTAATLTIEDPDTVDRLAVAVPTILGALAVGIVITLVLEVVRSLREGDPFTLANARTLAQAAVASVVGGVVVALAQVGSDAVLRSSLPDELPVAFSARLSNLSLVAGLLLATLAQVFHRGVRLREDLEGVI